MDYLVYAYLQLGQDTKANAVIEHMRKVAGFNENFIAGPYALAASPARYAVERGDWKGAATLEVRSGAQPHVQAVTYFARALGAARSGDPDAAQAPIAKLAELRDQLRDKKDAYWAEQVDIQRQIAVAWAMDAAGKHDDALKALSAAADAEDRTEKHPVTPGPLVPARELYGAMLLERGMAKDALAAFEATLKKGAETAGSRDRRRKIGREDRRRRQGTAVLRGGRRADRRCRPEPDRGKGRAIVSRESSIGQRR